MNGLTKQFMEQVAAGIGGTLVEHVGVEAGFVLIAFTPEGDGTDIKTISNMSDPHILKEILEESVKFQEDNIKALKEKLN